jgi:hypothetical protein
VAPTFVGAGNAVYGSADSWPSSLLIGSGDVPSGIVNGDRLILFVSVYYQQDLFPSVDDSLGSFDGLSTWTTIPKAQFLVTGTSSNLFWQLWAYTVRYSEDLFPLTISPLGTTSGTAYTPSQRAPNDNYRAQLYAWSPSHAAGDSGTGSASALGATLPSAGASATLTNADGILVAAAAMPYAGAINAFSTARSFTEQYHQTAITNRGGSLKVADYAPGSAATYTGPQWSKQTGTNLSGVAVTIAFNDLDPALDQWGMNVVRW